MQAARELTEKYLPKAHVQFRGVYPYPVSTGSLLLTSLSRPETNRSLEQIWSEKSSTHLPARNLVFLSFMLAMAEDSGIRYLITGFRVPGVNRVGSGDATKEFEKAFEHLCEVYGYPIQLISPVQGLTKTEAVKRGLELGLNFQLTYSCFQGKDPQCGICDACQMRRKSFADLGEEDPTLYSSYPIPLKGGKKE